MKRERLLVISVACVLLAGAIFFWTFSNQDTEIVSRSPQSNATSEQIIANKTYDATNGAEQVIVLGRGVTSPQSNNLSTQQIANYTYDATNGAKQVIVSSNSSDIPFVNYSGTPANNEFLQYNLSATSWENRGSLLYPSISDTQASYSIAATSKADRVFVNYTSGQNPTVHLMSALLTAGRQITVADVSGYAATRPITIDTEGSEKISGKDTFVLPGAYHSVTFLSNGSHWFVTHEKGLNYNGGTLLLNGSFTANTTSWTAIRATLASVSGGYSGNCLQVTLDSGSSQGAYQDVTTVANREYLAIFYVKSGTSGNEAYQTQIVDVGTNVALQTITGTSSAAWVMRSIRFLAQGTSSRMAMYKNTSTSGTMLFDEAQIYEIF